MTFVVTEPCVRCRYTDCVAVCPMDCFVAAGEMLVIHPDECIECAMCVPECPVDAIAHATAVPPDQRGFVDLNARLARAAGASRVTARQLPPPDAAAWVDAPHKRRWLPEPPT